MSGAMHVLAFKLRNSGFDQHISHSTCVSLETRSIYRVDGSQGEGPISPRFGAQQVGDAKARPSRQGSGEVWAENIKRWLVWRSEVGS